MILRKNQNNDKLQSAGWGSSRLKGGEVAVEGWGNGRLKDGKMAG